MFCMKCGARMVEDLGSRFNYDCPNCFEKVNDNPQTEQAEASSLSDLLCCPFCGTTPDTGPKNPEEVGDAFGFVRCVNMECPAKPYIDDGEDCCDDRGTDAYIAKAIERWNKRAIQRF